MQIEKKSIVYKPFLAIICFFLLTVYSSSAQVNGPVCSEFTNITNGLGSSTVRGVYVSGDTLYAATAGGLSISTDGGETFSNKTFPDGLGSNSVNDVFASGGKIYAATDGGLSISTDGGETFSNIQINESFPKVNAVYALGDQVYAATDDPDGGLSFSIDGGITFSKVNFVVEALYDVHMVGSIICATGWGTIYFSTNGGVNWGFGLLSNTSPPAKVYVSGNTIFAASNYGIETWPTDNLNNKGPFNIFWQPYEAQGIYVIGNTVYAATTGGVYISRNGGASFSKYTSGLGNVNVNGVFASGNMIYAATNGGLSFCSEICTNCAFQVTDLQPFNFCPGIPSEVQTFSVSAVDLDASTVTITAPTGFEIRKTGDANFVSMITLPVELDGTLVTTSVDTRVTTSTTVSMTADITLTSGTDTVSVTVTATAAPPENINVKGNNLNIFAGDNAPDTSDDTQFGVVLLNTPTTKTYTIQNTGTGDLVVSAISLAGADPGSFVIGGISLPATIAQGSSTTFTVSITANSQGLKAATVVITSNDTCSVTGPN